MPPPGQGYTVAGYMFLLVGAIASIAPRSVGSSTATWWPFGVPIATIGWGCVVLGWLQARTAR